MVIEMRDRENRRNRERGNEPSAVREIPGTDYDLFIYEGRDRKTGAPYYHWRLVRTDGERYFSTSRPFHLLQMARALQFAAIGFSRIEGGGIDLVLREKLAALALALQNVSLAGDDDTEQKVNGLGDAFGSVG